MKLPTTCSYGWPCPAIPDVLSVSSVVGTHQKVSPPDHWSARSHGVPAADLSSQLDPVIQQGGCSCFPLLLPP